MSIIDSLIYDRTNEDLNVATKCIEENKPFPSDNLRFSWDYRALNRTEEAMKYLNDMFVELGYYRNMKFKYDWTNEEITPEDNERYIRNLKILRDYLTMESDTPLAPNTINGMSINRANDIEKILHDIDIVLERMTANFRYANDVYSGEGYFS